MRRTKEQGLGLVSAIFVITILALLAGAMAQLTTQSAQRNSQQILSERAQHAVHSALAVQRAQLAQGMCALEQRQVLEAPGLKDCVLDMRCEAITSQRGLYKLRSSASCGTGADSAVRMLERRVRTVQ